MTRLNKFMVYNPKKGKPIKYYKDYFSANQDAEILSKKENTSVLVLKVVDIAKTNKTPIGEMTHIIEDVNRKIHNLISANTTYKNALIQIEYLIAKSVNPDETSEMSDSLNCLYEAIDICRKVRVSECI